MHKRYDHVAIPTELLRTLVVIAEERSYTRAAELLALTQPAVSFQVKRLQQLIGTELFEKGSGGTRLNDVGESVAIYARKILALNEQILSLSSPSKRTLRVGLSRGLNPTLLADLLRRLRTFDRKIHCSTDTPSEQTRALEAGFLDIALLSDAGDANLPVIKEWQEPLYWVRAPNFVFSPGASLPLITWPGGLSDRYANKVLREANIKYASVFVAADVALRIAAAEAGIGVMATPLRSTTERLIIARDYYLPALPSIRTGIYAREGLDLKSFAPLVSLIEEVVLAYRPLKTSN